MSPTATTSSAAMPRRRQSRSRANALVTPAAEISTSRRPAQVTTASSPTARRARSATSAKAMVGWRTSSLETGPEISSRASASSAPGADGDRALAPAGLAAEPVLQLDREQRPRDGLAQGVDQPGGQVGGQRAGVDHGPGVQVPDDGAVGADGDAADPEPLGDGADAAGWRPLTSTTVIPASLAAASAARVRSDTVSSGRSRVPSRSLATSLIPPMHPR